MSKDVSICDWCGARGLRQRPCSESRTWANSRNISTMSGAWDQLCDEAVFENVPHEPYDYLSWLVANALNREQRYDLYRQVLKTSLCGDGISALAKLRMCQRLRHLTDCLAGAGRHLLPGVDYWRVKTQIAHIISSNRRAVLTSEVSDGERIRLRQELEIPAELLVAVIGAISGDRADAMAVLVNRLKQTVSSPYLVSGPKPEVRDGAAELLLTREMFRNVIRCVRAHNPFQE